MGFNLANDLSTVFHIGPKSKMPEKPQDEIHPNSKNIYIQYMYINIQVQAPYLTEQKKWYEIGSLRTRLLCELWLHVSIDVKEQLHPGEKKTPEGDGGTPKGIKLHESTWVFPKIGGKPPKWMVKIMENPMNKWMIWGVFPYFWKHPHSCSMRYSFTICILIHSHFKRAKQMQLKRKAIPDSARNPNVQNFP